VKAVLKINFKTTGYVDGSNQNQDGKAQSDHELRKS